MASSSASIDAVMMARLIAGLTRSISSPWRGSSEKSAATCTIASQPAMAAPTDTGSVSTALTTSIPSSWSSPSMWRTRIALAGSRTSMRTR